MLKRLETSDMVVGARIGSNVKIPAIRKPAKWALNQLANYMMRTKIPDLNNELRAFRRDVAMQYFGFFRTNSVGPPPSRWRCTAISTP